MKCVSKQDVLDNRELYISEINNGKIFIFPTDTTYQIGGDARNKEVVEKIRKIKGCESSFPLAVIAPSKEWILDIAQDVRHVMKYMVKLPGAYTLIIDTVEHDTITKEVSDEKTLGIRQPEHWFYHFIIKYAVIPFVSTSANSHGETTVKHPSELGESVLKHIDYCIEDGILAGPEEITLDLRDGKKIKK